MSNQKECTCGSLWTDLHYKHCPRHVLATCSICARAEGRHEEADRIATAATREPPAWPADTKADGS
jgi:hypothetical protein